MAFAFPSRAAAGSWRQQQVVLAGSLLRLAASTARPPAQDQGCCLGTATATGLLHILTQPACLPPLSEELIMVMLMRQRFCCCPGF